MNLLKSIKSNTFALVVAILSVFVQSFHSYTAFYNTSSLNGSGWGIAQAALFAIVIDLAILFYTVRNRREIALGAAFVMVIINSYYYFQHLGLSFEFAFGVFLSLIIPVSVYFYSEEIKDEPSDIEWDYDHLNEKIAMLQDRCETLDTAWRNADAERQELLSWKNEAKILLKKWDTVDAIVRSNAQMMIGESVVERTLDILKDSLRQHKAVKEEMRSEFYKHQSGVSSVKPEFLDTKHSSTSEARIPSAQELIDRGVMRPFKKVEFESDDLPHEADEQRYQEDPEAPEDKSLLGIYPEENKTKPYSPTKAGGDIDEI